MQLDFMRGNDTKNGPPCQRVSATPAVISDRSSHPSTFINREKIDMSQEIINVVITSPFDEPLVEKI